MAVVAGNPSPPASVSARVAGHPVVVALRACWRAAPRLTILMLTIAVARGVVPNLLYLGTSVLAAELAVEGTQAGIASIIGGITLAYFFIQSGEPIAEAFHTALGRRVDRHLQRSVILAAIAPRTIGHLETEAWREAASAAREWETSPHPPSEAVSGLSYMITATVWALGSAFFLIQFVWWAPLLVMAGWLVMTLWGTRFREGPALASIRSAIPLRRSAYYRDLAFEASSARESRLFGLATWLRDRSERSWQAAMARIWQARAATRSLGVSGAAILVGGYLVLMTLIMQAAFDGRIDVAQATLYVQACGGLAFLWMPWAVLALKEGTAHIPQVVGVTAVPAVPRSGGGAEGMPRDRIVLRNVRFAYPGRPVPVFDGLDLTIRAGQSIAIVGANGAGKTTLVKLLCGLLDPDEGEISIDGVALATLDRTAWQGRVAAIFQEFVRYPFSARDNIILGRPATSETALDRAIDRAMAGDAIQDLPDQLGTPLSREFGGQDLSGGQWQRIALARAMYAVERAAGVLILDEPTAHLDIRAEAELFDRFLELTAGLTTVLISHRFSSVRHADRIVVIDGGRIVEDGAHAGLLAAGGLYASMFRMQAQHFGAVDG
jgi:ATP-binding cassette, subfamily B, bacterial